MSAKKTLDILNLFDFDTPTLTVPEIAERLEQPQSSVYRHLRLLKDEGFVIEENGTYKLGYRFLKFAKIIKAENSIASIAKPVMKQITNTTGETSILLVRSGFQAVCLETVPAVHPIKVSSEQGEILPLYGGASSKPILAYMEDKFIEELFKQSVVKRYTENTPTDINKLKENLKEIRDQGYAVSDGEVDEGIAAYGVPIRDLDNEVVASLSIAGPRERILQKDEKVLIKQLKSAAKEIEKYI